jgi:tRNA A-37 threonylcarbamoyl transferase component Bud32
MQRAWDVLGPGGPMPRRNSASPRMFRKFMSRTTGENRYFGQLQHGGWSGHFYKHTKYPRRWSLVSRIDVSEKDWQRAWPQLLGQIEADQLTILKRTRSGDVLAGEVVLGGRPVPVIVKHPRKKYIWRYVTELGRGVRARRAWRKAWNLIVRNIPTAWPMILMEKRVLGYVTDAIIVFERIPGAVLANTDLDAMPEADRDTLFRRTGRLLRQLERTGLHHGDAKANNWIVLNDEKLGPTPILIDMDGIRRHPADAIHRLLRSMRQHPQYTPADSLALCQGYAPHARLLSPSEDSSESEISNLKFQKNPHPDPLPEYRERG